MYRIPTFPHTQRGAALIVALSILLILTILGVSAMSTTALQERMAGNARDYEVAFEAAEAALRAGEATVDTFTLTTVNAFDGTGGKYPATTSPQAWTDETKWGTAATTSYSLTTNDSRYIIQVLDADIGATTATSLEPISYTNNPPPISGGIKVFQITARGYGLSANSRVMLQSYYGKAM